jgi:hypothetical protein
MNRRRRVGKERGHKPPSWEPEPLHLPLLEDSGRRPPPKRELPSEADSTRVIVIDLT